MPSSEIHGSCGCENLFFFDWAGRSGRSGLFSIDPSRYRLTAKLAPFDFAQKPGRYAPSFIAWCPQQLCMYSLQPLQPALVFGHSAPGVARHAERSGSITFGNEDVLRTDWDET
eukprot:s3533_g4.t1